MFAPPRGTPSALLPPPDPPFLDTTEGETAFFRALIHHRPVGPDRHWHMLAVELSLRDHSSHDWRQIPEGDLWRKYGELFDVTKLEEMVADQEAEKDEDEIPKTEFALTPLSPSPSRTALFTRGERGTSAPSSPPPSPTREISVPVQVEKRAAPTLERRSAKKVRKNLKEEESGSELSELEGAEEESEEESREGGSGDDGAAYVDREASKEAAVGEKIRSMPPIKRNTRARSGSTVTDGGTSAKDAKAAKEFEKKEAAKIRRKERDQARKREATELKEADQARKREAKEVKEAKEAAASSKAGRGRESRTR